jgi:hypothetical protein
MPSTRESGSGAGQAICYEELGIYRLLLFPGSSRELEGPQRELEGPAPRFSHVGPGDVDELRAAE